MFLCSMGCCNKNQKNLIVFLPILMFIASGVVSMLKNWSIHTSINFYKFELNFLSFGANFWDAFLIENDNNLNNSNEQLQISKCKE